LVWWDLLDHPESLELLDIEVQLDELDPQVQLARLEQLGEWDQLDPLDIAVLREQLDQPDMVTREQPDLLVPMDLHQPLRVQLDQRVSQE
jgi:hypothetical protein